MRARSLIISFIVLAAFAPEGAEPQSGTTSRTGAFSVVEASIADLRRALDDRRTTSKAITEQYLARLERYNGTLHAAITINPRAIAEAEARDCERDRRPRSLLHGIPIAVKDNIQTLDMPTTGGALAFRSLRAPYEATIVRQLRDAGAIIIAKTTLTELANWVSPMMPPGYNAILGYSGNPYDLRRISRNGVDAPARLPGGSSSGIGTAASLWAASVGTETSGSILNPAGETLLVGIKPTVGRLSRYGVIPIAADQDTPGPMARSVADAAILLGAMETAAPDTHDRATRACQTPPNRDYTRFLGTSLKGVRIGVPRASFVDRQQPVVGPGGNIIAMRRTLMEEALAALRAEGAVVVDPADLPSIVTARADDNVLQWSICSGRASAEGRDARCSTVLRYGMKRDFNAWLTSLGAAAPLRSLTELRAWNTAHEAEGAIAFGQEQLDVSDAVDLERDRARYLRDREKDLRLTREQGIDAVLQTHTLDALLFPSYQASPIAARAGYPSIIVPFPAKSTDGGTVEPFGVTFTGTACSEPRLIAIAHAFEQATKRRVPPRLE